MQHFNTDSKHSGSFSNGFLENAKDYQSVPKVINLLWNQKVQGTRAGEVAFPCWQFLAMVPSHQQLLSARVKWQQLFCAQAPMSLLSRAGSLNALWSTEMWDCLCLRAHESSELEPGVWRLPAPGWRTGRFFEFVDNSEQTALKRLRLSSTSCSSHLLHIKICYSLKHWLAVSSRLVALCGVWFSVFLKVFPI